MGDADAWMLGPVKWKWRSGAELEVLSLRVTKDEALSCPRMCTTRRRGGHNTLHPSQSHSFDQVNESGRVTSFA